MMLLELLQNTFNELHRGNHMFHTYLDKLVRIFQEIESVVKDNRKSDKDGIS